MKVEYRIHRDICIAAIENAIKRMCSRYLQIRSVDDFHIDSLTFIAQLDFISVKLSMWITIIPEN